MHLHLKTMRSDPTHNQNISSFVGIANFMSPLHLQRSAPSRIVTLSSVMHTRMYNAYIHWDDINLDKCYKPRDAYSQSKLMNVLFSRELSRRLKGWNCCYYYLEADKPGLTRSFKSTKHDLAIRSLKV